MNTKTYLITILFMGLLFLLMHGAIAQSGSREEVIDSMTTKLDSKAFADSKESDFIKFMLTEQKEYRAFIERTINWVASALLFIVTIAGGLFVYFYRSSFKEIKASLKDRVEEQSRPLIEKSLTKLINEEIDPLRKELYFLQQFQNAEISFIGNASYKEDVLNFITPFLNNSNITQIYQYTNPTIQQVKRSTVLVYWYEPKGEKADQRLQKLLQQMKGTNLPLVLYSPDGKRLKADESKWMDEYKMYFYANMPMTLLVHLVSAAKMFFKSNYHQV